MEKSKTERKPVMPSTQHGAMERCKAVLSVWTERRRPSEVCREYSIPCPVLKQWQDRALEGMMAALTPRVRAERGPALSERLSAMLERRQQRPVTTQMRLEKRLARRLRKIQETGVVHREETPAKA